MVTRKTGPYGPAATPPASGDAGSDGAGDSKKPKKARQAGGPTIEQAKSVDVAMPTRVRVVEIMSRMSDGELPLDILERISVAAAGSISVRPDRLGAQFLRQAVDLAELSARAAREGDAIAAAWCAAGAVHAAWQAEITEGRGMIDAGVTAYRAAETENLRKAAAATAQRATWQAQAEEVWSRRSSLSASDVARLIDPTRFGYIRKHIKRPDR